MTPPGFENTEAFSGGRLKTLKGASASPRKGNFVELGLGAPFSRAAWKTWPSGFDGCSDGCLISSLATCVKTFEKTFGVAPLPFGAGEDAADPISLEAKARRGAAGADAIGRA